MRKISALIAALFFAGGLAASGLTAGVVNVEFVNNSGYPDNQVYLWVIGKGPGGLGYYDFTQQSYVTPRFSPVTGMTTTLAALESGGETDFSLPQIVSGRIYFSYGADFDVLSFDPVSGEPGLSPEDRLLYDKLEFDTSDLDVLLMNTTNVDFWSLPFTFQAFDKNTGLLTTYGFQTGIPGIRNVIFNEFESVADRGTQECANPVIFRENLVQRDGDGTVWRVVAPDKVVPPDPDNPQPTGDWGDNFQYFSYFWNDYVKELCWAPDRTINLHYNDQDFVGTVNPAGDLLTWTLGTEIFQEFSRPAWETKPATWPSGTYLNENYGHIIFGGAGEFEQGLLAPVVNSAIQRGVMHLPGSDWFDQASFYQGTDGPLSPVNHYGRILHKYAIGGQCYALSYDDGGGYDTAIVVEQGGTFTITLLPMDHRASPDSGDYTGDGTSDIAIFRPASGLWAVRGHTRAYFGTHSDRPVFGDYNGNGTAEIAIFRPGSGLWAVRGVTRTYFGTTGDLPVPGDYTGDGAAEIAIFRPASGLWAVRGVTRIYFGSPGDIPIPGYYSPDGGKSPGVFRPASGLWVVRGLTRAYFGSSTDRPVPGDYNGNRLWDQTIFRPASGLWAIRGLTRFYFGGSADNPTPGGYRGDGKDYPGIFRDTSGLWAIRGLTRVYFGTSGDVPATR